MSVPDTISVAYLWYVVLGSVIERSGGSHGPVPIPETVENRTSGWTVSKSMPDMHTGSCHVENVVNSFSGDLKGPYFVFTSLSVANATTPALTPPTVRPRYQISPTLAGKLARGFLPHQSNVLRNGKSVQKGKQMLARESVKVLFYLYLYLS